MGCQPCESSPFIVKPKVNVNIIDLKSLIRKKGLDATEHAVDAADLALWKVDLAAPLKDKLKDLTGRNVAGSVKLEELKNISDYWLEPDPKHLQKETLQ